MTKDKLREYPHLKRAEKQIRSMLEDVEARMLSPRIPNMDGMPKGKGGAGSAVEDMVEKHIELQRRYLDKLAELTTAQAEIERAIAALPNREQTLLRLHYLQDMTWEQVCVAMCYSWRQVHRIHGNALAMLQEMENPPKEETAEEAAEKARQKRLADIEEARKEVEAAAEELACAIEHLEELEAGSQEKSPEE